MDKGARRRRRDQARRRRAPRTHVLRAHRSRPAYRRRRVQGGNPRRAGLMLEIVVVYAIAALLAFVAGAYLGGKW